MANARWFQGPLFSASDPSETSGSGEMPRRVLGRTGERVSCIGLGGSHIGKPKVSSKDAIRWIRAALDRGMNFLDNSWDYNDGASEIRMGKALQNGYRDRAFLMTKFDGRNRKEASKQIDESLKRLNTDYVDLMQFHEVIRYDDVDRFFAPDGACEALREAKAAGKTRYLGFTGHKDPHIHLYMLESADRHGFRFDTVQMPLNVFDAHYRSFGKLVLPEAVKREMGILGMKSMGDGVLLKSGTVSPAECLRYALQLPVSVVITGIDCDAILEQAFRVASTFRPMPPEEVTALLAKTSEAAMRGEFELFKTTAHFDSTAEHPEWMGDQPEHIKELLGSES
jgi:aryl-alcohol dehydrogenase-like predicted oxidoreductase